MSAVGRGMLKWALALLATGALVVGAFLARDLISEAQPAIGESINKKLEGGRIKLSAKEADLNTQVDKVKEIDWLPKVAVYGRVVSNPDATTEVRAAFAGRLRSVDGANWPTIAAHVKSGERLGSLEVRPIQDRLDLVSKLSDAKVKLEGARKVWFLQQDRVKRFELAQPSIARSELDAALVALAEAETQVAVSEAAAKLWQDALAALTQNGDLKRITWTLPIVYPSNGEITELVGRPDMLVEAGTLIAKVVDFRKTLVRVDVPVDVQAPPPPTLELSLPAPTPPGFAGPTNRPEPAEAAPRFKGTLLGAAPQVDVTSQASGYLYQVTGTEAGKDGSPGKLLRPGLFVKALVDGAGKAVSALAVPQAALVYHQGRALVYIQLPAKEQAKAAERQEARYFQRVEVNVLGRAGDRIAITGFLAEGDAVVSEGAVYLLSAEFRTDTDD
jgi:hypothetical protein